jgi:hypothetical protein
MQPSKGHQVMQPSKGHQAMQPSKGHQTMEPSITHRVGIFFKLLPFPSLENSEFGSFGALFRTWFSFSNLENTYFHNLDWEEKND